MEDFNTSSSPSSSSNASRSFFDGNPKMLFVFGLVTGVALTLILSSLTGSGTSLFAMNNNGAVQGATDTTPPTGTVTAQPIPDITSADHIRGDIKKAKVVIVEYSDFQCPFCERHHPTLQQIFSDYGGDVAWVYRHFPLTSIHPEAMSAAIASECADDQGKFWEYADALFANQDKLASTYYPQLAGELGLDVNKFNTCLTSAAAKAVVTKDQQGGIAAGVNGTPATFIDGVLVADSSGQSLGAAPYSTFKSIIDAEIAKK